MTTLVLDAGGLSALAGKRAKLQELLDRGLWPAQVPAVVLAEALTGDHRRDFHINRLVRTCQVRVVDEPLARAAASLRTATGRAKLISAVDAVVVALAEKQSNAAVLTSDPLDIGVLAEHSMGAVSVIPT